MNTLVILTIVVVVNGQPVLGARAEVDSLKTCVTLGMMLAPQIARKTGASVRWTCHEEGGSSSNAPTS